MDELTPLFLEMDSLCEDGYNCGFHFRYSRPTIVRGTYREDWRIHYALNKFILADPGVVWGIANTGTARWSEIDLQDPLGVMGEAARFGYRFGLTLSTGPRESRSLGTAGRADREFSDPEIDAIFDVFLRLHAVVARLPGLKSHQQEVLQLLETGLTYDQICGELGISRTAVVHRLKGARKVLGVTTNAEAIRIAVERGFITSTTLTGVFKGLPFG
ncbi:helix-turn-helix transcriptional regulator [Pseudooceanicola sp. LIPI14-2-Ac024]|uniref:helix-turn-helix transcriptional regulator n=1 Tax=Pseudooceanicola sp. LIPI14-2-Ac024 TaxID=3344875 RepID=UPI0035D01D80